MRAAGLLYVLAALGACSKGEAPDDAGSGKAGTRQTGWALEAGTYEYTRTDGAAGLIMLAGDGTYSDARSGGDLETGTWRQESGVGCLVPQGSVERCYKFGPPDGQGRVSGKAADGSTMAARKIE